MRTRVEVTMEAEVPVNQMEMRAAAAEAAARLSHAQLEVLVWFSAYLLEQAETVLPESVILPALRKATAERLGSLPAGLVRPR